MLSGVRVFGYPELGSLGRLGNQLWQVAATIARSRRVLGSRAYVPPDWEYRPFLRVPEEVYAPVDRSRDELVDVRHFPEGPYFQELEHIAEVIRDLPEWYSPSDHGLDRLMAVHGPTLERVAVRPHAAIHVRRTDYLENPDRFLTLDRRYWHRAVQAVLEAEPDAAFLVFSDDVPWCRDNAEELGVADVEHDFVEGHVRPVSVYERTTEPADVLDLWLMARCYAQIIANSTFSWWGAFLSEQRLVLYPSIWYGSDAQGYDKMWNAFPTEWRRISAT